MGNADGREQEPEVVVNFRDGSDGRARTARGRFLLDRNGWTEPIDRIYFGPLHLIEKLARIRRQSFNVTALSFRVDRVKGQRTLTGTAETRDDGKRVAWDLNTNVFQIVLARAMHRNAVQHGIELLLLSSIDERRSTKWIGLVHSQNVIEVELHVGHVVVH
jgi:hypothetical protein